MSEPKNLWLPHVVHALIAGAGLAALAQIGVTVEVMQAEGWWTTFLVVNAGVLVGNVAAQVLAQQPDEAARIVAEGRRQDLVDSHRTVVELLRNLEAEKQKLAPADYDAERASLLAVGASALRELEGGAAAPTDAPVDPLLAQLRALRDANPEAFSRAIDALGLRPAEAISGEWRGAGWTVLIFAVCGLLVFGASSGSHTRRAGEGMTGGDSVTEPTITGPGAKAGAAGPAGPMPGAEAPENPMVTRLKAELEQHPDDLAIANKLTTVAIASEDMATALKANQQALKINPNDPEARTYNAVLKAFIGRKEEALKQLDEITAAFPDRAPAFIYGGLLTLEADPATALKAFEAAAKLDDNPEILQMIEVAKRKASGQPGPSPFEPAAGAGGPPAGPPGAPGAAAGGGDELLAAGRITLADASKAAGKPYLFVFLKAPSGGPPFAALKLDVSSFPLDFTLTRANLIPMMAGRPLPPQLMLQARLDTDGNATTKDDPEVSATIEAHTVGTSGAVLDLK